MSAPANTVATTSGRVRVAERHRDAWPRLAGRAAAHRVDDDHERSGRPGDGRVDLLGGAELLHAETGELLAHRRHKLFRISHPMIVLRTRRVHSPQGRVRALAGKTCTTEP